jgi:hypothetical protein
LENVAAVLQDIGVEKDSFFELVKPKPTIGMVS